MLHQFDQLQNQAEERNIAQVASERKVRSGSIRAVLFGVRAEAQRGEWQDARYIMKGAHWQTDANKSRWVHRWVWPHRWRCNVVFSERHHIPGVPIGA